MLALTREVEDASFILSGRIHGSGKEAVEALEIMRRNYYEEGVQDEN